jgi:hypothetical protein
MAGGCASDSGGGSSGDSDGSACDQGCLDDGTGYGIIETLRFLYNANLAGRPVGTQNVSASCPLGGGAVITGTTSFDSFNGITGVNLTFSASSCRHSDGSIFDLTLTGAVNQSGTFSNISTALSYSSTALAISGSVYGEIVVETCSLSIARSDSSVTGVLCGRSFSY